MNHHDRIPPFHELALGRRDPGALERMPPLTRGPRPPRRPSAGLVLGVIALFVSLSGSALALSTGSIGSREVANESLRSADLKDGVAVTGADVADDALTGADIDEANLALGQGVEHVESSGEFAPGFFHRSVAHCPDQSVVIGGGYRLSNRAATTGWNASIEAVPFESRPLAGDAGWIVDVGTPNQEQIRVIAHATCVRVSR